MLCDLPVSGSHSLVNIPLHELLYLRVQLEDLLIGFHFNRLGIKHPSHELFIGHVLDWVLGVVVLILKEGIVTLAVASSHLNLSHSSTISHVANHA
jgi:hypothetical protein